MSSPPSDIPDADASAWLRVTASGGKPEMDWGAALVRMYRLWGELSGHQVQVVARAPATAIVKISGPGTYRRLQHEDGIHRIERVLSIPGSEKLDWVHALVDTWPEMAADSSPTYRYTDLARLVKYMRLDWDSTTSLHVFRGLLWKGGPLFPPSPAPSDGPHVRTYALHPAPRVFDERCEWETRDVERVLDGNLDELLDALAASER